MTTPEAKPELLPCPWCGGSRVFVAPDEYTESGHRPLAPFTVGCQDCRLEKHGYDTEAEAREDWNRRPRSMLATEGPAGAATASPANPRGVKALSENEIASVEAPDPRTPDRRSGTDRRQQFFGSQPWHSSLPDYRSGTDRRASQQEQDGAEKVGALGGGGPEHHERPAGVDVRSGGTRAGDRTSLLREYERRKLTYTETLLDRYTNHATRLRPADVDAAEHSLDLFVELLMRRTRASVVQPQEDRLSEAFESGWLAHEEASCTEGIGGGDRACQARFREWLEREGNVMKEDAARAGFIYGYKSAAAAIYPSTPGWEKAAEAAWEAIPEWVRETLRAAPQEQARDAEEGR